MGRPHPLNLRARRGFVFGFEPTDPASATAARIPTSGVRILMHTDASVTGASVAPLIWGLRISSSPAEIAPCAHSIRYDDQWNLGVAKC